MTVVTINDVVPPGRNDAISYVSWFIEESSSATGSFVQIDTGSLIPVDPNPMYPASRDITTANGSAESLWYRIRFRDANGDYSEYTEPIWNGVPPELPDVRQVAAHLPSRTITKDSQQYVGTFTDKTRPTDDEAAERIEMARDDVLTDVGALPVGLQPEAYAAVRALIALRAAMIIERGFYPEQIGANKSAYPALRDDYNARLPKVVAAIAEAETNPPGQIVPGDPLNADTDGDNSGGTAIERDYVVSAGQRVLTSTGLWLGAGSPPEGPPPDDDDSMIGYGTMF